MLCAPDNHVSFAKLVALRVANDELVAILQSTRSCQLMRRLASINRLTTIDVNLYAAELTRLIRTSCSPVTTGFRSNRGSSALGGTTKRHPRHRSARAHRHQLRAIVPTRIGSPRHVFTNSLQKGSGRNPPLHSKQLTALSDSCTAKFARHPSNEEPLTLRDEQSSHKHHSLHRPMTKKCEIPNSCLNNSQKRQHGFSPTVRLALSLYQ